MIGNQRFCPCGAIANARVIPGVPLRSAPGYVLAAPAGRIYNGLHFVSVLLPYVTGLVYKCKARRFISCFSCILFVRSVKSIIFARFRNQDIVMSKILETYF